jgi:hypothetical protein
MIDNTSEQRDASKKGFKFPILHLSYRCYLIFTFR